MTKEELVKELKKIPNDFDVFYETINEDGSSTLNEINIIGYIKYSEKMATLQI